jgi:hypothetical protein
LGISFLVDMSEDSAHNDRVLAAHPDALAALLDQMCERNISKSTVRKSLERAKDAKNLEWLQELIALQKPTMSAMQLFSHL